MIASYIKTKLELEYDHLSLWYIVSFIFGIIIFFQIFPSSSLYFLFFLLSFNALFSRLFYKKNIVFYFCFACFTSIIVGMITAHIRLKSINIQPITKITVTEIKGEIESIKPTTRGMQLIIQNISSDINRKFNKLKINITNDMATDLNPGDIVQLKAKLFPLQSSVLPDAYDFGFYMYMSGIEAGGYALNSPIIINSNPSKFSQYIKSKRTQIYKRLINVLGIEKGNFAAAILIGETKAIPKNISENMRNSGVAHILSVSGLHLSLVAMIFFIVTRALLNISNFLAYNTDVKIISAVISMIGSFTYLQISGNNIAATRAFIMTSIFIFAIIFGRSPYPLRSVMIAACVILLFLPECVFHPSFQLSFAAVLCLISGYELYIKNKNLLGNSKGVFAAIKFYLIANIYSSFLAGVVTAPFVIYHFYKFPNYSIFMNLLSVPLMSFFMMPLALLSLFLMPIGYDLWVLESLGFFISIIIYFAEIVVNLPFSVWYFGHISSLSLLIFSFGFFWICLWKSNLRIAGLPIMIIAIILMLKSKYPDFIYDHNLKMVAINSKKDGLKIYSQNTNSEFTLDYWQSWFGYKSAKIIETQINGKDKLYILDNGKNISLNYWNCQKSDISIITSRHLKCKNNQNIIDNNHIWKNKKVFIYCDSDQCSYKNQSPSIVEY